MVEKVGHGIQPLKKCNTLSITRERRKSPSPTRWKVVGIRDTKYLGITFNDKLTWDVHIANISGALNRMLYFVTRNLRHYPRALKQKAYMSYVCPKLELFASILDPHQENHAKRLEMVQHRVVRFVTNTPYLHSEQQNSITRVVEHLGWPLLAERRRNIKFHIFCKVTNNLVEVPLEYHPYCAAHN